MTAMDGAARRLGDEVGSMSARARQLERTIAALPRRPVEPAAKDPKPAPAAKEAPRAPERPPAPPATVEVPAPMPPPAALPHMPEPAAAPRPQTPEPVVSPRPRAPEPVAHRPLSSGRATIEAPLRNGDGGAAMSKPTDPQLTDKLREDWKTIRGGLSTAGEDVKAAFRDLGRKLWR